MAESENPNSQETIHIGIKNPQLSVADSIRNKLAEIERGEIGISPLPDTSEATPTESIESISEKYKKESEQTISERRSKDYKKTMIEEMSETRELLDKDHELYTILGNIIEKIKPEAKYDLYISLDDHLKVFTLNDHETLVFSAGLFTKFQDFLNAKYEGKKLTEGHMALILGHELSHWDKESDARHLGETYCDVNGFFIATKHYNSDDAVEALEFLHWIEDESIRDRGDDPNKVFNPPITHPSSENREVMANLINNDEEVFINGRYIDSKEFHQQVVSDFIEKANEWKESIQRRQEIASEADVKKEFESAKTLSQIIETFLSAEDYFTAKYIRDFADSDDFGKLLLGLASTPARENASYQGLIPFKNQDIKDVLFSEFDLVFGQRAKLISKKGGEIDSIRKGGLNFKALEQYSAENRIIQDSLDGKFDNPLELLTLNKTELQSKTPELADFEYNDFFEAVAKGVNKLLGEKTDEDSEVKGFDRNRINVFGLEPIDVETLLYKEHSNIESVKQTRQEFLEKHKYLVASYLVTYSQLGDQYKYSDNTVWPTVPTYNNQIYQAVSKYQPEIDYNLLFSELTNALTSNGICKTDEVANDVALMILSTNNYAKEFNIQNFTGDLRFKSLPPAESEISEDLLNLLKRKAIKVNQGSEIYYDSLRGSLKPHSGFESHVPDRIDAINDSYSEYIHTVMGVLKTQDHDKELVDLFLNSPEITVADKTQKKFIGRGLVATPKHIYEKNHPQDKDKSSTVYQFEYCFSELEQEQLEHIILSSYKNRITGKEMVKGALLNMDKKDLVSAERIIDKAIQSKSLSPEFLVSVLDYYDNLDLYYKYFPYVTDAISGDFYGRLIKDSINENQSESFSKILTSVISKGGVLKFDDMKVVYNKDNIKGKYYSLKKDYYLQQGIDPNDIKVLIKGNQMLLMRDHLFIDEGDDYKTGDLEFFVPKEELSGLGDNIVQVIEEKKGLFSDKNQQELLNLALVLKLQKYDIHINRPNNSEKSGWIYGESEGKQKPYFSFIEHQYNTSDELRNTVNRIISEISNFPDCYAKDGLISEIISLENRESDEYPRPSLITKNEAIELIGQFSSEFFQLPKAKDTSRIKKIPVSKGAVDISDFIYVNEPGDKALSPLSRMVYYNEKGKKNGTSIKDLVIEEVDKHTDYPEKLDRLFQIIDKKSGFRDFLMKQALVGMDIKSASSEFLNKIFSNAYSEDLQSQIGYEILKRVLKESDYEEGITQINNYFQHKSVVRDDLIRNVVLEHDTSWSQISEAESMMLGYDYSTQEKDPKRANIVHEAISTAILQMQPETKSETLLFLLDKDKHFKRVPRAQEEYDLYFDLIKPRITSLIENRLFNIEKRKIIGANYTRWDSSRDKLNEQEEKLLSQRVKELIEQALPIYHDYFYQVIVKGVDYQEYIAGLSEESLNLFRDSLNYAFSEAGVLQLATPVGLNGIFNQILGDRNSYNSIGTAFLAGPSSERRKTFYSLCMGNKGLMSDENFETHGKETINKIIDLVTSKSEDAWNTKDVETIKKVAVAGLSVLEPDERAERLYKFINLLMINGEKLTRAEILKAGFLSFKAVGAKAGQMDVLLPNPDLLREMVVAKEQVGAIPKATIVKALENTEITKNYAGLGPILASGSIGVVVPVYKENGETDVLKIVRPELTQKEIRSQLNALKSVLGTLIDEGVLSVDVNRVVDELGTMMSEEIDLRNEVRNMVHVSQNIQNTDVDVKIPEVREFGERYMIMEKISGVSLERIKRIHEKQSKGEQLTEEETIYANTQLPVMYEKVVDYVFQQVFNAGEFNTDPHTGNFFVTDNGKLASLDHGQYGQVEDADRKNALLLVLIGTALENPKVTASGLKSFVPQKGTDDITAELAKSDNLLSGVLSFISNNQVQGSINRFTKTLSNILSPYIESLDKDTMRRLLFKHIKVTDLKLMAQITKAFAGV